MNYIRKYTCCWCVGSLAGIDANRPFCFASVWGGGGGPAGALGALDVLDGGSPGGGAGAFRGGGPGGGGGGGGALEVFKVSPFSADPENNYALCSKMFKTYYSTC